MTSAQPSRAAGPRDVLVTGLLLAALAWTSAGCGNGAAGSRPAPIPTPHFPTCSHASGFDLSLASDTGGQATPVAAAAWFAAHGGVPALPRHGWRVVGRDAEGANVRSGSSSVHVVQGSDATWLVDGGTRCED